MKNFPTKIYKWKLPSHLSGRIKVTRYAFLHNGYYTYIDYPKGFVWFNYIREAKVTKGYFKRWILATTLEDKRNLITSLRNIKNVKRIDATYE